jgi:hypothetical protein
MEPRYIIDKNGNYYFALRRNEKADPTRIELNASGDRWLIIKREELGIVSGLEKFINEIRRHQRAGLPNALKRKRVQSNESNCDGCSISMTNSGHKHGSMSLCITCHRRWEDDLYCPECHKVFRVGELRPKTKHKRCTCKHWVHDTCYNGKSCNNCKSFSSEEKQEIKE